MEPGAARVAGDTGSPVFGVPDHWMPNRTHVHADLMCTARLQRHTQQCHVFVLPRRQATVVGDRRPPVVDNGHPRRVVGVASDRRLDRPGGVVERPEDQRPVLPADFAPPQLVLEDPVGRGIPCDEKYPGRVAIEAVNDAPAGFIRQVTKLGKAIEEPAGEGSASDSRSGMDDDTGRLVHHDRSLALEDHLERHRWIRLDRRLHLRNLCFDTHSGGEADRGRDRSPIHEDTFTVEETAGDGTTQPGHRGEDLVRPMLIECVGNDECGQESTPNHGGEEQQGNPTRDGGISYVERRDPPPADPVDHRTIEKPVTAEGAIDEIADGTTEHHPEGDRLDAPRCIAQDDEDQHDDTDGDDADERTAVLEQREGGTGVRRQPQPQEAVDDDDVTLGERTQSPCLRELVERNDDRGDDERQPAITQTLPAASTTVVAYGSASSLASGIGFPVTSHMP